MSKKRKPSYLLHKATGQARVRIDGKDEYLGEYGSRESRDRYDDLIAEWLVTNGDASRHTLRVDDLALLYMKYANTYYIKNGQETSEIHKLRSLLRLLVKLHGRIRIREFGPTALREVRDAMIESGWLRRTINENIHRIRRIFRWAVSRELAPVSVVQTLETVEGLKRGRSSAKESTPVLPIDDAVVEATLPFLTDVVADMVRLQRLAGMRPGECCSIRPCDVTFGTDGVWAYRPEHHKTEHHGRERIVFFGPKAQTVLRPYLDRDAESYCFSPLESESARNANRKANRKSQMTPSQSARQPVTDRRRPTKDHYTKDSYRRAITRGCEAAFEMPENLRYIHRALKAVPKTKRPAERKQLQALASEWRSENCWAPNRLRHTAATVIRAETDIETVRVVLGHSSAVTSEIYAEKDFAAARSIMAKIG